ncbi:MAG TPA: preprotein translocase subunit SecG [Thermoanaerobaculia bacterium]|nr:preprotein translocase subunit SecG [Thermoanaerobaculia bacterium]
MIIFLVVVHIIVSFFLMLAVLLQPGKGADLAGAFGGGGSQTVFGARGATTLLQKLTVISFILFIVTSMTLAILQTRPRGSVMEGAPAATAPATPAEAPATPAEVPATPAEVPAPAPEQP